MLANDERNKLPKKMFLSINLIFLIAYFRYFKDGVQKKNDFLKLMCLESQTRSHYLRLDHFQLNFTPFLILIVL